MISKKNHELRDRRANPHKTRYALRKFSTGLASVAIATLVTVGVTASAKAADNAPTTTAVTAPVAGAPTANAATPANVAPAQENQIVNDTNPNLADQTIINDSHNATAIPVDHGIQHTLTVTANGQSTTPGGGNAIMNANELDQNGNFDVNFTANNTTTSKQRVDQIITLPGYTYGKRNLATDPNRAQPVIDATRLLNGEPQLVYNFGDAKSANATILYATVAGQMKTLAQLQAAPDFSWDKIIEIQIYSDLLPGQSYSMTVPMKIANMEQMKKQLATLLGHPATSAISNADLRAMNFYDLFYYLNAQGAFQKGTFGLKTVRLGVPDLKTTNELLHNVTGHYVAQTLIKNGDHFSYYPVPANIQALLPNVEPTDIHILDFSNGANAAILFTDGIYTIDTSRIFNAIKNAGYSTNIYPAGNELWPVYTYNATNHLNVTFVDRGDGKGTVALLDLNPYVQVQKIFDPKDITIPVNTQWDQANNLNAAPTIEYTSRTTMSLTAHPTLTFNQDPNSDLNTYQVDYSALPTAMVDGHLVVTKAGVYPVVFSHKINDHDIVTATAYVTVTETKDFQRTINYVDQAGKPVAQAPSVTQTVQYLGTPQKDGTIVWTPVTAGAVDFPLVTSPTVAHMTPDQVSVAEMPIVTSGANETPATTTVTVTYSPNMVTTTSEQKVTRTIHYVDQQGTPVAPDATQTVTLTKTTVTNELTGQATTTWTTGEFPAVTSPTITDMTTKDRQVPAMTVTDQTANQQVTVVYAPIPKGSETTPEQPGQPGQPTNPGITPEAPTQPGQPAQPDQPSQPLHPTTPGPANQPKQPAGFPTTTPVQAMPTPQAVTVTPGATPARVTGNAEQRLPQTGNDHPAAAAALGLFGLTAGLGLLATSKKRN